MFQGKLQNSFFELINQLDLESVATSFFFKFPIQFVSLPQLFTLFYALSYQVTSAVRELGSSSST
jgi:hypothetical protein